MKVVSCYGFRKNEFLISLECTCNSIGAAKIDNSNCTKNCCNSNGSCTCKPGYIGMECQDCDNGYILLDDMNGDKICSCEL